MEKKIMVCCTCGGTNIEVRGWIDPNTREIKDIDSGQDDEDTWCNDCEDHMGIIDKEHFVKDDDINDPDFDPTRTENNFKD